VVRPEHGALKAKEDGESAAAEAAAAGSMTTNAHGTQQQ